jgi:hypothetical protein
MLADKVIIRTRPYIGAQSEPQGGKMEPQMLAL